VAEEERATDIVKIDVVSIEDLPIVKTGIGEGRSNIVFRVAALGRGRVTALPAIAIACRDGEAQTTDRLAGVVARVDHRSHRSPPRRTTRRMGHHPRIHEPRIPHPNPPSGQSNPTTTRT